MPNLMCFEEDKYFFDEEGVNVNVFISKNCWNMLLPANPARKTANC